MPATIRLSGLLLTALIMMLQGCGFHLRGTQTSIADLPPSLSPLQITGLERGSYLKTQLENRLMDSGVQTSIDPLVPSSTLHISGMKSDRRVLAVDSRGKVIEYLLTESLVFDMRDKSGEERVAAQSVELSQSYINAEDQVLGQLQEEQSLKQDMWRRMADQIIRRLAAQLR